MTKICGDLAQLRTLVADFDKSVQNYKFAINSFFKDIETYDSWEGDAVDTYKSSVESDSVNYYNFIDDLIDFSNELSNIIDNAESSFATATKR